MSEERAKYVVPRRDGPPAEGREVGRFLWAVCKLVARGLGCGFAVIGILAVWGLSSGSVDGMTIEPGEGATAAKGLLNIGLISTIVALGVSAIFDPLPGMRKGEDS